jgi:phosphoenolpyruvate synthase/pyruvate phosphate dikinase
MKLVLPLEKITKKDFSLAGSKAFRLAELKKANFNIPRAFVLTIKAFDQFLADNNLSSLVARLTLGREEKFLNEICQELREKITKGKIKSNIRQVIQNSLKELETDKMAVRSSATCEDGETASFAGQFESFLPLFTDQILEGVRKCWASVFSPRILTYALFHEIPFYKIKMACLIQEMVEPEKGGLVFTKNILNGQKNALVIEALAGSPEEIVSATGNPNRWIIDKKTAKITNQTLIDDQGVLTKDELENLRQTALKIERFYQKPQDIEWAIKDGQLFILQTRPITA